MDAGILIPLSLFLAIFGIFYLYFSTRNKERLALIEKGVNATIFNKNSKAIHKAIILNLGLLLMGIGLGVFSALILSTYTSLDQNALYPASIFTVSGIFLLIGFKITKKLDE